MKLDYDIAAALLSQLGNITRLKIVRELVRAGNAGKPVGEIRNTLDIPNSTLSHHLSHLRNVGLIRQEREGTVLRCFVNYDHIDGIVSFLTKECCVYDPTYIKTEING
jgi:DNA-binding transcriptional ArsR family regulator